MAREQSADDYVATIEGAQSDPRVAPVELFFDRNEDAEVTGFTLVW